MPMQGKNRVILLVVVVLFGIFSNNRVYAEILEKWDNPRAYRPIPIIFLHGFAGGDYRMWRDERKGQVNITAKLWPYFFKYYVDPNRPRALQYTSFPFLEIGSFINHFGNRAQETVDRNSSIDTFRPEDYYVTTGLRLPGDRGWADKLNESVNEVLDVYQTDRVILIAHSMGGLASREYLTNHLKYGAAYRKVPQLITMGTPHLGSFWATFANNVTKIQKVGWFCPIGGWAVSESVFGQEMLVSFFMAIDMKGDAIKDMTTGSPFLSELNTRNQREDNIEYDLFVGKFLFFRGDIVVLPESQQAKGVLPSASIKWLKANHCTEAPASVGGLSSSAKPLLAVIDSTRPEVKLVEPADISSPIKLETNELRIKGEVRREYLPADSKLYLSALGDSRDAFQESYLKPSDLWDAQNPESPVAEFDEIFIFPKGGKYRMGVVVQNPGGKFSEEISFDVEVGIKTETLVPVEQFGMVGYASGHENVCSAAQEAYAHPSVSGYFGAGIGSAKCQYIEDTLDEEGNIIESVTKYDYRAGAGRSYLSFDTSFLRGKEVREAKLVLYCQGVFVSDDALPFYVHVYSGNWDTLDNGFSINDQAERVGRKNVWSIHPGSQDIYPLRYGMINTEGKTMFRICSEPEEYRVCPGTPNACPFCDEMELSDLFTQAVLWDGAASRLFIEYQ